MPAPAEKTLALARNTDTQMQRAKPLTPLAGMSEWDVLMQQAEQALRSGFLPKSVTRPEQAVTIAMAGRDFHLSAMQSFRGLHVIEGKITMDASMMKALIHRDVPGARFNITESTDRVALVVAQRPGGEPYTERFTMEDANRAGLTGKDVWKKYPKAMLRARAISAAARAVFPDVLFGVYTPEELEPLVMPRAAVAPPAPALTAVSGEPEPYPEGPSAALQAFEWALEQCATLPELETQLRKGGTLAILGKKVPEGERIMAIEAKDRRKLELQLIAEAETDMARLDAQAQAEARLEAEQAEASLAGRQPGQEG